MENGTDSRDVKTASVSALCGAILHRHTTSEAELARARELLNVEIERTADIAARFNELRNKCLEIGCDLLATRKQRDSLLEVAKETVGRMQDEADKHAFEQRLQAATPGASIAHPPAVDAMAPPPPPSNGASSYVADPAELSLVSQKLGIPPAIDVSSDSSVMKRVRTDVIGAPQMMRAGAAPSSTQPNLPVPLNPVATRERAPRQPTTTKHIGTMNPHSVVSSVSFVPNVARLATGLRGSVSIWDISSKTRMSQWFHGKDAYIRALRPLSGGAEMLVAGESDTVCVYDVQTGMLARSARMPDSLTAGVYAAVVSPDSRWIITGSRAGYLSLWDAVNMTLVREYRGHTASATSVCLSHDGSRMASGSLDETLRVWDVSSGNEITHFAFSSPIFCASLHPNSSHVAVGLENAQIEVINVADPRVKFKLSMHDQSVMSVRYSNDGDWMVSTGRDSKVVGWRAPIGGSIFHAREPNKVLCSDVSANDQFLATGSAAGFACLYSMQY